MVGKFDPPENSKLKLDKMTGEGRRKINMKVVLDICKETCPEKVNTLISVIKYKTGFTHKTVVEFLEIFYDTNLLTIDEEKEMVTYDVKNQKG